MNVSNEEGEEEREIKKPKLCLSACAANEQSGNRLYDSDAQTDPPLRKRRTLSELLETLWGGRGFMRL